jgi:Flp pilus assembly protein TadD
LADIAGLSTHRLADLIVLVFNLTRPCLEGSIQTYHSFTSDVSEAKVVQLVASPVPPLTADSVTERRLQQAEQYMPLGVAYGRKITQIVYDPAMVLTEELPVRHPGRFPAAERYESLRESIQRANPEEVFPVVEQAQALRTEGRLEEGLSLVRGFTEKYPQKSEGFLALGDLLLEAGRAQDAVAAFRAAGGVAPTLALAYRRLGDALILQESGAEAVEALQRAEALGDTSYELYRALTRAYGKINEPGKELEARRKSIATLLGNPDRLKASPPDVRELRREFIHVLSRRPPYPGFEAEAFWDEVMCSLSLGLQEKALLLRETLEGLLDIKSLRVILQDLQEEGRSWLNVLGPGAPELQKRVAASFVDVSQEGAADQLREGDVVDAALLGFIAVQTEDLVSRREFLQQALAIKPDSHEVLDSLAATLLSLYSFENDEAAARALLLEASAKARQANEIKPGAGDYNLACALSRLGEASEAATLIQADLQRRPYLRSHALQDPDLQPLWTARPDLKAAIEKELAEAKAC